MSTPVNTAVVGDLNLCFMWLDDPFVLAVLEKLCETKNYVKRLVEGFLFFSFSFEIVKSTRNHIRNYIRCQLGNLCYAFSWQDFRSYVRRVDRIGRDIVPVMIWLKVPGVVRPYLWGVGGMTIDELNESCICHQVRFEAEEGRWVAMR